jgi:hypothetical protein
MTQVINTSEKTFNNTIKKMVVELIPNAKSFKKSHIAGCGYVYFIKDENQKTLAKVLKESMKGMKIIID